MDKVQEHMSKLGLKATDKVTGFKGVVSSISFDLYGCIQAVLTPKAGSDGKQESGRYYDICRLKFKDSKPVMELPDFMQGAVAEGRHGPAEKPAVEK